MIKRLSVRNFGPYENSSIDLDKFTLIVGQNGAGKSMLFSALRAIGRVARFPLRSTKGTPNAGGYPTRTGNVSLDELLHRGETTRTLTLAVDFAADDIEGTYEIELGHWHGPGGTIVSERLEVAFRGKNYRIVTHADGRVDTSLKLAASRLRTPRFETLPSVLFHSREHEELGRKIQDALWGRVGVFRFDPAALKTPAEVGRKLTATGYNFASYLDEIRNQAGGKETFESLLERFHDACPHVKDVLLPYDAGEGEGGDRPARKRIALVTSAAEAVIPADLESDGTILLLAYAALLYGSRTYDTLCIEEPENGVHPKAITKLAAMLRGLTEAQGPNPGAQVVVCSHSAKFLEEIVNRDHSVVRLVRRGTDGRSTIEAPTAAQLPMLAGWAGLT